VDEGGKVTSVVKIGSDISIAKVASINNERQLGESYRTMAVIEFNSDGIILNANDNFLNTMGYRLDEIKGKHHSMFAEPDIRPQRGLPPFLA
jgi:methyl-accepting chemotaxis protein